MENKLYSLFRKNIPLMVNWLSHSIVYAKYSDQYRVRGSFLGKASQLAMAADRYSVEASNSP